MRKIGGAAEGVAPAGKAAPAAPLDLPRHWQLEEVVAGLDVDLILFCNLEGALLLLKGLI